MVGKVYAILLQIHIENYLLQRLILYGKPAALLVMGQKIMYLLSPTASTEMLTSEALSWTENPIPAK